MGFIFLLNLALMPLWTRHGAAVSVPEVRRLGVDDAEDALADAGLRAEFREQPFNPNLPPDVVVDQNPLPSASVKPGRRVYVYVNTQPREMVRVPDVTSRSEGVARADLQEAGLVIGPVRMDSVHSPYEGTVTRQVPRGGSQLPRGSRITLWLSPGLGRNRVTVPDVTGLSPTEARRIVREVGLWVDSPNARGDSVRWQEPQAGTRLREGEEVRIHTTEAPVRAQAPAPTAAPPLRTPPRTPQREPRPERAEPREEEPAAAPAEPVRPPAQEDPEDEGDG